jgi:hypothetical protein
VRAVRDDEPSSRTARRLGSLADRPHQTYYFLSSDSRICESAAVLADESVVALDLLTEPPSAHAVCTHRIPAPGPLQLLAGVVLRGFRHGIEILNDNGTPMWFLYLKTTSA